MIVVLKQRTSNVTEPFKLLICLDATKFFTLKETICPKICLKSRLKNAKSPPPAGVRRSETSLIKPPVGCMGITNKTSSSFAVTGYMAAPHKKNSYVEGAGGGHHIYQPWPPP